MFAETLKLQRMPYSWARVHEPRWGCIALLPLLRMSIPPILAFTSFFFVGTTRNARSFYEHCLEWIYDHLPKKLGARLSVKLKISETRRKARTTLDGLDRENHVPELFVTHKTRSNSSKPDSGSAAKHWFDSEGDAEGDAEDRKSVPSSEGTDSKIRKNHIVKQAPPVYL